MRNQSVPPILLLAFNRPGTTARVIDSLRPARPDRVFFAVDGPREAREGDRERVAEVQRLAERIDWPCTVSTLFRPRNLGCKLAVSEAITWFFDEVQAGVILEDDCLPHPSFFRFVAELLERYRDDERIALISGNNFQFGRRRSPYSYYYSRYNHIWGWATWRRAWRLYDHRMRLWPEIRDGGWLADILRDPVAVRYWTKIFDATHAERNTSWAYRWTFACWVNGCVSILPNVNLVSNIGFGDDATHTRRRSAVSNLPAEEMTFPLSHPPYLLSDARADARTERVMFSRAHRLLPLARRAAAWLRWRFL